MERLNLGRACLCLHVLLFFCEALSISFLYYEMPGATLYPD